MARSYHVVFDTGEHTQLTADQLADLSTDMASWLAFAGMAIGGPPALMTVHAPDGQLTHLRVGMQQMDGYAPSRE